MSINKLHNEFNFIRLATPDINHLSLAIVPREGKRHGIGFGESLGKFKLEWVIVTCGETHTLEYVQGRPVASGGTIMRLHLLGTALYGFRYGEMNLVSSTLRPMTRQLRTKSIRWLVKMPPPQAL